ncbi:glycosyltransferase [Pseudoalteromonas sp. P1-25]|uniref:glycosyltransferase n=1 Tax=Pseudoalteromonas sp. P1-25 TaxID=1723758 RepID=UPI0006D6549F|nr:glycosyltransferase [Pseudoalteromonas sp. P1-25]KPZ51755.1 GalNAc-N,N'-diacetylbacillosaminyl-diphospho-undecaprenol 4-alpha-N-acetylgalactosaminyltransferase [Pseudoalteromonas sp. P1-25]
MKKVLYVVDKIEGGGATRIIVRVANMLSDSYSPYLTSMVESHGYSKYDLTQIEIVYSDVQLGGNVFQKAYRLYLNVKAIVSIIKANEIDCVLSFLERSNFCAVLAAKITKKKVIISVRNNIDRQYSNFGGSALKAIKFLLSKVYSRADHIVSLSKGVKAQLVTELSLNENKVSTIYNPYYLEDYVKQQEWREKPTSPYFLAVGRLEEQKGFNHLIKAFYIYRELGGKNHLYILGDGVLKTYLNELVDYYELKESVNIVGFTNNVKSYMHNAEAFIFSSLWEGFGNALVEAILCSLPVISTDCDFGPAEIMCCQADAYPFNSKLGVLVSPFELPFEKAVSRSSEENEMANVMFKFEPRNYKKEDFLKRAEDFSFHNVKEKWSELVECVI